MPAIKISYIKTLLMKIMQGVELKLLVGFAISGLSFLFDNAYHDTMIALLILIVFDFITSIAAQKKHGHPIVSAKIFRSAKKVAVYFLLISAGFLAERGTQNVLPIIDETIMGFLAVTELISILENIGKLGYAVPQKLLNQLIKYKNNK